MASFEQHLANLNRQTLHKSASGSFTVEVIDDNLVPVVKVTNAGATKQFPLDKIGLYWSDGDQKFRSEADDSEVSVSDVHDLAVEALLFSGEDE